MARRTVLSCDICGETQDVGTLVVSHPRHPSWEMEVCRDCYIRRFSPRNFRHARTTSRTAGRPLVRLQRTVLPKQPDATPTAESG